MKVKIVTSRWLRQKGRRLDVGPYLSGALEAEIALDELSVRKCRLGDLVSNGDEGIYHAGREGRTWVEDPEYGVQFLSSSAILKADLSYLPLISRNQIQLNPNFVIRKGWTLITRFGTVGRMAYTRQSMDGRACSEHVMRVVPDSDKIRPGYLYAFLSSRFGVPLITSGTYGAIIQRIEPHHIANLPVPRLGSIIERQTNMLIEEAAQLLDRYQRDVNNATSRFFGGVGYDDITRREWHAKGADLNFPTRFPRVESFRALNFNSRYIEICNRVQSGSWRPLGEICVPGTLKRGGRFKRIDASAEHAVQLIGQKQLFWLQPEGRWIAKSAVGDDVLVEPGTILVAAQGTLGESELFCRAEFAWGVGAELAYSEHILRVVADESVMLRGALFAFMRSETAFRMLRSISVGTKLQDHHYVYRFDLPVPYPTEDVQYQIHRIVINAYEARHRAVALEAEARSLVEQAIEDVA